MTTQSTTNTNQRSTQKQDWRLFAAAVAAAIAGGSAADAAIITGSVGSDTLNGTAKFNIGGAMETASATQVSIPGNSSFRVSTRAELNGQLKLFVTDNTLARNFYKGESSRR